MSYFRRKETQAKKLFQIMTAKEMDQLSCNCDCCGKNDFDEVRMCRFRNNLLDRIQTQREKYTMQVQRGPNRSIIRQSLNPKSTGRSDSGDKQSARESLNTWVTKNLVMTKEQGRGLIYR